MSGTGFFSDKILQRFALSLLQHVTSFVETGTCEGDTAKWMADNGFKVFTCETKPEYLADLMETLPAGVALYAMSSDKFVVDIKKHVGTFPLIFLDAHGERYWPLQDELRAIGTHYNKAIIIVHDCKVPGRENFWYCSGGGSDNEGPACDWEYIKGGLDKKNKYRLFYPTYNASTPGYLVLFQNCDPIGELSNLEESNAVL